MRLLIACALSLAASGFAKDIVTNSVHFVSAPTWLSESQLEETTGRIEKFLEWSIRRVKAYAHRDLDEYRSKSRLNFSTSAFFDRGDGSVHIGPGVTVENFDRIFGHELVHAIFWQKYRGSIPSWLEEGLANYIGRSSSPDYAWLATQTISDVTKMKHPNADPNGSKYHYQVSTALIEMITAKCSLKDLLQLSVGSKMTTYLSTYCEIKDLNASFRDWVRKPTPAGNEPWWKKKREKAWWEK